MLQVRPRATWLLLVSIFVASVATRDPEMKEMRRSLDGDNALKLNRERRSLIFPSGSIMQMSLGIGVNPNLEDATININFGFQQNVPLPTNITELRYPTLEIHERSRKLEITNLYGHLENNFERYGFQGGDCLKKSICEMASTSFQDGLFENIIAHLLSPSLHVSASSVPESVREYRQAEEVGLAGQNCDLEFPSCPMSPFGIFTQPEDYNSEDLS